MKSDYINILNTIDSIDKIQSSLNLAIDTIHEQNFFNFNFHKLERKKYLISHFKNSKIKAVFLTQRIQKLITKEFHSDSQRLEDNFFTYEASYSEKLNLIKNSIVIVNNNDTHVNGQTFLFEKFVTDSPTTLFCAWDWDNHHWLSLSCKLAGIVDLYCPSHNDNLYVLSKFNETACNVIPCATVQWSEQFLLNNKHKILTSQRSNDLLGKHIPYNFFKYRMAVISKISEKFPYVGFSSAEFHNRNDEEKLQEWMSHKIHLIVPVLNDIPIRIFDAWSTGGIPLVPSTLEGHMNTLGIHDNDIFYYDNKDVLDMTDLVNNAIKIFDFEGEAGIKRRFEYGINNHHGNIRLQNLLKILTKKYSLML